MRARNYLTADEWQARLDREMERVLRDPAGFPEATVWWARWRREWLAESGSLFREPAGRAETAETERVAGPSSSLPAAGGTDRTPGLAAAPKNWPKRSARGATTAGSTTSARPTLSLAGDNRNAHGAGIGARAAGGGGGGIQNKEV